jgi:hypothetical protein
VPFLGADPNLAKIYQAAALVFNSLVLFALLATRFTDFVGLLVDCFLTIRGRLLEKGRRKPHPCAH